MQITEFDPQNIKQTQALTKKYCMPMDSKKFIKWRGKIRRSKKNGGSVTIETDTHKYLEQVCKIYRAKYKKGFTLKDVAIICALRYMAAVRSLKNAIKCQSRLSDYQAVVIILKKIISDSEEIYNHAMAKIEDAQEAARKAEMEEDEEVA